MPPTKTLWFDEVHNDEIRLGLKVKQVLFSQTSPFQKIDIVETAFMGRALMLDDVWMTSEGDEFYYHEMIVHPALTTAPRIDRVLVVGGGDGGTVREVLRHAAVRECVMVEIDEMVVEACKSHLPTIGTAWEDPRLTLHFEDAIDWVARYDGEPFDVIIVDGSDPVGPAEGLFGQPFYESCRDALAPQGVFVTQSESSLIFPDTHLATIRRLETVFGRSFPYYSSVALYCGGEWSWTYASRSVDPLDIIDERARALNAADLRVYNADYHRGAFALPNAIKKELGR